MEQISSVKSASENDIIAPAVLHNIGDILRYGQGPTALMQVTFVSEGHGGATARYFGAQCMGGSCGTYHDAVGPASDEDRQAWTTNAHWRTADLPLGSTIIASVED